jgi:hypothetical protein
MSKNMNNNNRREEMLREYYETVGIVNAFTSNFLTIKTWSVTSGSIALGVAFAKSGNPFIFLVALILSAAFWITEIRYKIIQLAHLRRAKILEEALQKDEILETPRINATYSEAATELVLQKRWKKLVLWPQIMLPHVFIVIASLLSFFSFIAVALWNKQQLM